MVTCTVTADVIKYFLEKKTYHYKIALLARFSISFFDIINAATKKRFLQTNSIIKPGTVY